MNDFGTARTNTPARKTAALLGVAALSIALVSGCGGGSSGDGDTAEASSGQGGDSTRASGEGLPEGFPSDVPLPDFTSAKKIGGESGPDIDSPWWSLVVMLENPTDNPVEDYAAQLSDAGYTLSTASGTTEAEGPDWEISFHSSMDNTLTVAVMSK